MAAPTTAPVRVSPPTWLPLIAPTPAPAAAAVAEVLGVARHRAGPARGEALVVRLAADRVGVARHFDRRVGVLLEHVGHLPERLLRGRAERGRVEVKADLVG